MNLLVTETIQWTQEFLEKLNALGHDVKMFQDERLPLHTQGIDTEWIEGVVCNALFIYNDISNFSKLKWIQLTSAGLDRVPMDYIRNQNIAIYNARGVYSVPMAEFVICGVLQLYKQSRYFYGNQKNKCWKKHRDLLELYGKTVCIIGCGSVGTECAKRFKSFGCRIIGLDLFTINNQQFNCIYPISELNEILRGSDIVVLTIPLTKQTFHLINKDNISNFKKNAILVNISRGGVIDYTALKEILDSKLGGAVLDVFENEPLPPDDPLWKLENVILTPHNSFVGENNRSRLENTIINNLINENYYNSYDSLG